MMRLREAVGRATLLLAGILVALAAAEGWARWMWAEPSPPPARTLPPELAGLPVIEDGRGLIRPNARGLYAGVLQETNRWGFRGPDVPRLEPPGTVRIVLIGDSIAMGMGVPYAQTRRPTGRGWRGPSPAPTGRAGAASRC